MKTIFILSDSLNRYSFSAYGNSWIHTPNIDRFVNQSVVFDNHWLGSAPCMPARRDIMTGRLHFLEREWGGLEPFDIPFPGLLREAGIYTHMVTDHYHYFHVGGENYHTPFSTWELYRGQEYDAYGSFIAEPDKPKHLGKWSPQYQKNRAFFSSDADYPTPKTFGGAINWLKRNEGADDFLLWLEVFDPHEPFDCPDEYIRMYEDQWKGLLYNWSGYEKVEGESEETIHLRKQYAGTITMMDRWFGKLIDELERQNIFEDTLIIFTTDHGHMLGEHDVTGKNFWHAWNEMSHLPLVVHLPGNKYAGERRKQLTQNIDIMPTLMDYFSVQYDAPVQGESLRPVLEQNALEKKKAALYGWFGQSVNLTDGTYTYFRAPATKDNQPLYHYFLTPGSFHFHDMCDKDFYNEAEIGPFLPYTDYPVIKARARGGKSPGEYWDTLLFNIQEDYAQLSNLAGGEEERKYEFLLREMLSKMDSPFCQFERLGL